MPSVIANSRAIQAIKRYISQDIDKITVFKYNKLYHVK